MSEKQFYIRSRGKISGPFGMTQLRSLRDRGQFRRFHEVSEDRKTWMPAGNLTDLFPVGGGPVVAEAVEDPSDYAITVAPSGGAATTTAPQWFYVEADGTKQGPVPEATLVQLRANG